MVGDRHDCSPKLIFSAQKTHKLTTIKQPTSKQPHNTSYKMIYNTNAFGYDPYVYGGYYADPYEMERIRQMQAEQEQIRAYEYHRRQQEEQEESRRRQAAQAYQHRYARAYRQQEEALRRIREKERRYERMLEEEIARERATEDYAHRQANRRRALKQRHELLSRMDTSGNSNSSSDDGYFSSHQENNILDDENTPLNTLPWRRRTSSKTTISSTKPATYDQSVLVEDASDSESDDVDVWRQRRPCPGQSWMEPVEYYQR